MILLKYDVRHTAILPGILHVHDKHILPKPNPIFCDQFKKKDVSVVLVLEPRHYNVTCAIQTIWAWQYI